jgi:uncharacterized protein YecE (DUF72 family)
LDVAARTTVTAGIRAERMSMAKSKAKSAAEDTRSERGGEEAPPRGRLSIGTSGYSYKEWKGSFYPADIKEKDMLTFYAGRFPTVEVNYTFSRLPTEKMLDNWREKTPESFVFAIKAHQKITHRLRLANAQEAVRELLASVAPLADRRGPILFQCPPNLKYDAARLESFMDGLPVGPRYAFEFRQASWTAARAAIEERGMSWCVAETDDDAAGDDALASGELHYLRLRKTTYSKAELATWARRIEDALQAGRDVFCYFKHEETGSGPRFAAELEGFLGVRSQTPRRP